MLMIFQKFFKPKRENDKHRIEKEVIAGVVLGTEFFRW